MDAYTYMTGPEGHKYRALWADDDAPPRHGTHRQRDVTPKGHPLADIIRTMGYTERSRSTGESFEEWFRRTHPIAAEGGA